MFLGWYKWCGCCCCCFLIVYALEERSSSSNPRSFVRLENFIHALFPMQNESGELTFQQRWPTVPVLQHPFFLVELVHFVGGFVVFRPLERKYVDNKTSDIVLLKLGHGGKC